MEIKKLFCQFKELSASNFKKLRNFQLQLFSKVSYKKNNVYSIIQPQLTFLYIKFEIF